MPYIDTKLNFKPTEENILSIKSKLGEAIAIFPGKTEQYLMLNFDTDCRMFFAGKDDFKMAMIEVKVFGSIDTCDEMTGAITKIFAEELGISPDKIYVKYEECYYWGMGGTNF